MEDGVQETTRTEIEESTVTPPTNNDAQLETVAEPEADALQTEVNDSPEALQDEVANEQAQAQANQPTENKASTDNPVEDESTQNNTEEVTTELNVPEEHSTVITTEPVGDEEIPAQETVKESENVEEEELKQEDVEVQEKHEEVREKEETESKEIMHGVDNENDRPVENVEIEQLDASTPPPPPLECEAIPEEEEEMKIEGSVVDEFQEDKEGEVLQYDTESVEYPVYDQERLLQQYKDTLEERSKIQQTNQQIQHKLAEYFRKKKTDDRGQEIEKNASDQEQRYLKYMSNLEELQTAEARQASSIEIQMEDLKDRCQEKQDKVEEASDALMKFKYEVAKTAINSRSGKPISAKDLEQYQTSESKKEHEVIAVRLENIKLKNRLKKREMQLKAKEELAEGLHLIDFEQLKIENQTYNEKIEERNEELLKLRKKITTTVQVLTHLKEKLQFVQGENGEQRSKLRDVEVTVAQRRDILTRVKQVRDALRIDNNKLKHRSGLLGNEPLLRDFEVRKDEGEDLRTRLAHLKEEHAELNMNLNGIRKKIEKAKPEKEN